MGETLYNYDKIGRRTRLVEDAGGSLERATTTVYDDSARTITVTGKLEANQNLNPVTTDYDQLGRIWKIHQLNGGLIEHRYGWNSQGKYEIASNPYYSTTDTTMGWICTQYDRIGRVTRVASYSGAIVPSSCDQTAGLTGATTTVYDANETTITDPALKSRRSVTDAIGRLERVFEDPNGANYQQSIPTMYWTT